MKLWAPHAFNLLALLLPTFNNSDPTWDEISFFSPFFHISPNVLTESANFGSAPSPFKPTGGVAAVAVPSFDDLVDRGKQPVLRALSH